MRVGTAAAAEESTLTLFVAGTGHQSRESIQRAGRLADRFTHLSLRVVDIVEDPAAAESALVLVAPSLVLGRTGHPDRIIVGDLPSASELAEHLGLATPTEPAGAGDQERAISRIWESNPDGIVIVDADGTICFLNDACEVLLGRPAADLIGTPLDFHLAGDGRTELEIPRVGQIVTVELRTATIMWEGRRAVMATLRDVTERKLIFDELQRTRAELARSNEDLERFAAVAAHDLKAPLSIISGAAHLLADVDGDVNADASGTKGKELVDMITRSVARMTLLLDAVLDASHAGAEPDLQPTQLASLVRDVESTLRAQLEEAGATLDLRPLPTLLVDPTQVTELFQNLISNAIKYRSSERPLRIEVSSERADDDYVISVRDNGIGIDAGDRERVFTMLSRLRPGERQADGHGIGLSICRRVVERHGGHIWVDGSAATGTSFKFSLPGPVVRHA